MSDRAAIFRMVVAALVSVVLLVAASACGGEPTATPAPTPAGTGPTPTAGPNAPPLAEKWVERQGGTLIFGTAKEMSSPHP